MRTSADRTRHLAAAAIAAATGVLLLVTPALAAVSFDPTTGSGYVDKADVQAAFGWREQTFQANARKLSFHLETVGSLSWDCVVAGQTSTIVADVSDSRPVGSSVVAAGGRHGSVSGFDLTGFASAPISASCSSGAPANVSWSGQHVLYADSRSQSQPVWSD
jgi:hypothetical protein